MRRTAILLIVLAFAASACGAQPTPVAVPPNATATLPPIPTETLSPVPVAAPTDLPDPASFQWEVVAGGFVRPLDIQNAGDDSGRLFIVEQGGVIRILQNGVLLEMPFLDITDRVASSGDEQGLLGLAFHPDFLGNGFLYVNYTDKDGDTVIARFAAAGDTADPDSEVRLLAVQQPFPNHNGGGLAFGPDGYLYIALGDGGSGGDPQGNGQRLDTLLGKILRIDVNGGSPYAIPADNPFGNEILHYGLRNPWRFSFDPLTGDLWIGDVGQGAWEEIDFLPAGTPGGVNFGWNLFEGMHEYIPGAQLENHRLPLFEYSHNEGCSVTGGNVYRGSMPEWQGIYFYADFCNGKVWGALRLVSPTEETSITSVLFETGAQVTTFGVDEPGEIYIADRNGNILRLVRR